MTYEDIFLEQSASFLQDRFLLPHTQSYRKLYKIDNRYIFHSLTEFVRVVRELLKKKNR